MGLIRRVEVRYFRSIYRTSLNLQRLNIVSGRNDVGKSNLLKALNLFFNGDTDWGHRLDFTRDFCLRRLEEVRRDTIKGKQFISVAVDFNRPDNYSGSLPPFFTVRKKWLRDGTVSETNNLDSLAKQGRLPSSLETARRFLALFLNRIHLEYVPAVKDREYFRHLLSRLQATLLKTPLSAESTIGKVAEDLARHVQQQVGQLQSDFQRATGLSTMIQPPTELAALFQSFDVSTGPGTGAVPLVMRGDGIQARYVPSVLHYIASNSSEFFVWGFEEPENSLELSYGSALARDFERVYAKDAQIVVTTHSPAFVALDGADTACFRCFRSDEATDVALVSSDASEQGALLREELGVLDIQRELHEEYRVRIQALETQLRHVESLENEMRERQKPLLLTEGVYDRELLELAWQRLNPDVECPWLIRVAEPVSGASAEGPGGAQNVKKIVEEARPLDERPVIGLFDRDDEGIRCYQALSSRFEEVERESVKRHRSGRSVAVLLPIPPHREALARFRGLSLEFYFDDATLALRTEDGRGIEIGKPTPTEIRLGPRKVSMDGTLPFTVSVPDELVEIRRGKDIFTREIAPNLERGSFEHFHLIFAMVSQISGRIVAGKPLQSRENARGA